MSTLYMIRHGQASFGKENYDQLSEVGITQARTLAEYYFHLGIGFDVIYTGTLKRHLDTANQFNLLYEEQNIPCPPANKLEEFDEFDAEAVLRTVIPILIAENPDFSTDVENMFASKKSFQIVFEKAMMRWISDGFHHPGVISWETFAGKVRQGIKKVMNTHSRGKTIAIFSSGGPISAVLQETLSLENSFAIQLNWQIINSSVTRFKCTQDRIMMMSFNEHAHLEMKRDKELITYR